MKAGSCAKKSVEKSKVKVTRLKNHSCTFTSKKLEYLAVYGRISMGVPVGELQYGR